MCVCVCGYRGIVYVSVYVIIMCKWPWYPSNQDTWGGGGGGGGLYSYIEVSPT